MHEKENKKYEEIEVVQAMFQVAGNFDFEYQQAF